MKPMLRLVVMVVATTAGASCAGGIRPTADDVGAQAVGRLVDADAIEKSGAQTVWDALQLNVPFYVFRPDGQIEHRGLSSFFVVDPPVLMLDGVPLTEVTILMQVPASNVRSIEVLEGVAATTLYGTRARQGLIRICTKHGQT